MAPAEGTSGPVDEPAPDDGRDELVTADEPPASEAAAAPVAAEPAALLTEQQALADAMAARLEQAHLGLTVALGLQVQAHAALAAAEEHVAAAEAKLAGNRRIERKAVAALERQRGRVKRWAVQVYAGGSLRRLTYVLESDDINDVPRRVGLATGAFDTFAEHLDHQEAALAGVRSRRRALADAAALARQFAEAARVEAGRADALVADRRDEVAALDAGRAATARGVAFPVAGPARFADTFGAPRMSGTRFAHSHQGADVFAAPGTPVVAFERGRVVRLGTDVLGGTKLWLLGESGTHYYYAHLQGYAATLVERQPVEVGQTLGFVGNTGNASGTPHHLHFEIHPSGGPAVNPYPIIVQVDEALRLAPMVPPPPADAASGRPAG